MSKRLAFGNMMLARLVVVIWEICPEQRYESLFWDTFLTGFWAYLGPLFGTKIQTNRVNVHLFLLNCNDSLIRYGHWIWPGQNLAKRKNDTKRKNHVNSHEEFANVPKGCGGIRNIRVQKQMPIYHPWLRGDNVFTLCVCLFVCLCVCMFVTMFVRTI